MALAAKRHGLPWTSGRVSAFERGDVSDTISTFYVAAAALGDVTGRPVTLVELLAGKGRVSLNDQISVDLAKLRAALSGDAVTVVPVRPPRGAESGLTIWPIGASAAGTPWADLDRKLHWRVLNDFREADTRICKSIGVEPNLGAAAMALRWKHTFSAERDRRAQPRDNAQRRGQISRQLKAELQKVLSDGND